MAKEGVQKEGESLPYWGTLNLFETLQGTAHSEISVSIFNLFSCAHDLNQISLLLVQFLTIIVETFN